MFWVSGPQFPDMHSGDLEGRELTGLEPRRKVPQTPRHRAGRRGRLGAKSLGARPISFTSLGCLFDSWGWKQCLLQICSESTRNSCTERCWHAWAFTGVEVIVTITCHPGQVTQPLPSSLPALTKICYPHPHTTFFISELKLLFCEWNIMRSSDCIHVFRFNTWVTFGKQLIL